MHTLGGGQQWYGANKSNFFCVVQIQCNQRWPDTTQSILIKMWTNYAKYTRILQWGGTSFMVPVTNFTSTICSTICSSWQVWFPISFHFLFFYKLEWLCDYCCSRVTYSCGLNSFDSCKCQFGTIHDAAKIDALMVHDLLCWLYSMYPGTNQYCLKWYV